MSLDIEESKLLTKAITKCTLNNEHGNVEKFALMSCGVDTNVNRTQTPTLININDLEPTDSYYECPSDGCPTPGKQCMCREECNCSKRESDTNKVFQRKHLYPKVVVNTSTEISDIDSDEEDFHLRKIRKNDSGQGSSIETSSLQSNHCTQLNSSLEERDEDTAEGLDTENNMKNTIDNFHDIDLSSDDKFNLKTLNFTSNRGSPDPSRIKKENNFMEIPFMEIPLDSSSSSYIATIKPLNTYAPRKVNSSPKSESIWRQELIRKSKTKFLSGANQKSWTIFGKVAIPISKNSSSTCEKDSPLTKRKNTFAASTTALIFENRPSNLPQKSAKEEQKQREQYEEIITQVRKKEMKEKVNETKKMKEMRKLEDQLSNTVKIWKMDIIPDWDNCKNTKRVRELWWHGIPPSVRGDIWKLAIGNQLNMTNELFEIFLTDAKERMKNVANYNPIAPLPNCESSLVVSKENTVGLIALDVSRTFPSLCIFQKGGPYNEPLKHLLAAYTCHRPDVGYVQGMSFLAAVLLLNMDLCDAFICFSNLLNKPCQMAFFMVDQRMMDAYYRTFDVLLDEQIPRLHLHFKQECLSHDIYLIDWIYTLFTKSLPLDTACRVWDLFCRDGEEFLFRTALGILLMYEDVLLEMEFFRLAQYLTKLSNTITPEVLFHHIEKINIPKNKFQQTLSNFKMIAKSNPPPT